MFDSDQLTAEITAALTQNLSSVNTDEHIAPVEKSLKERLTDVANYAIKKLELDHNNLVLDRNANLAQDTLDLSQKLAVLDQKMAQIQAAKDDLNAQSSFQRAKVAAEIADSAAHKNDLCAAQRNTLSILHARDSSN